jgi:hypothetical protein
LRRGRGRGRQVGNKDKRRLGDRETWGYGAHGSGNREVVGRRTAEGAGIEHVGRNMGGQKYTARARLHARAGRGGDGDGGCQRTNPLGRGASRRLREIATGRDGFGNFFGANAANCTMKRETIEAGSRATEPTGVVIAKSPGGEQGGGEVGKKMGGTNKGCVPTD